MQHQKVQYIEIDSERAGQRIDNYLLSYLKGVPKSLVYRIIRKGEVRVNKKRAKADYRLQSGDSVRVPPLRLSEKSSPLKPSAQRIEQLQNSILYEDEKLLVINKPAGLAVHGGSGLQGGVIEILREIYPHQKTLELVHRLDKETSGCLMIAKKRSMLRQLHELLRSNQVNKQYIALVKGQISWQNKHVKAPLLKNILQSGERMVKVNSEGKPASTRFKLLKQYKDTALLAVTLETGRTHQIRVHAAHIGHPIVGDEKYGDAAFNKHMRQQGVKRLCLHAQSLSFVMPGSEQRFSVTTPESGFTIR